jgi:hypothetical protein
MVEEQVTIELSKPEALVLFELLSRFSDGDRLQIEDRAEERVLWNVQCLLERALVEPFEPGYGELLNEARNRLRDGK